MEETKTQSTKPRLRINRREFVKIAALGTAAALAPALAKNTLASPSYAHAPHGSPYRWAMVIDQGKCVGCNYCVKACNANNDTNPDIKWIKMYETQELRGGKTYLPVACQHCANPPCVGACPVQATYQRADGIVMMDYDRCIGCRYCEVACPYGARSFNWESFKDENPYVPAYGTPNVPRRERGVIEKCTFCYSKIDRGLERGLVPGVDAAATPACVLACPHGARLFGDLNDPDSPVSKALAENHYFRLQSDSGLEPRVYFLPARKS